MLSIDVTARDTFTKKFRFSLPDYLQDIVEETSTWSDKMYYHIFDYEASVCDWETKRNLLICDEYQIPYEAYGHYFIYQTENNEKKFYKITDYEEIKIYDHEDYDEDVEYEIV